MPTQNTDVSSDSFGIEYDGPGITWKIAKGVSVHGETAGSASMFADVTLVNKGELTSGHSGAAFEVMGAGDFTVKNAKSGMISAPFGVAAFGSGGTFSLTNKGMIDGANAAAYTSGLNDVRIDNSGSLVAELHGLRFDFATPGGRARIDNEGTIEGGNTGIVSFSAEGSRVDVRNEKGGLIAGDPIHAAIDVSEQLFLRNDGKIAGSVLGGAFNDKVTNHGKLSGDVFLAAGDDRLTATKKIAGDVALGSGDDKLVLKGKGKVTGLIDAGPGNDKVVFGKGADKFLFDSGLDALTNVTSFKNFASGKDHFFLDVDIFPTLTAGTLLKSAFEVGKEAKDADDRIIYDKKSGALYYDPDGTGAMAQVQFASLEKGTKVKASDFTAGEFSFLA